MNEAWPPDLGSVLLRDALFLSLLPASHFHTIHILVSAFKRKPGKLVLKQESSWFK
jgi:hypothetical protein